MTVDFQIEGERIAGINGGPIFKFTPSLSLFVTCQSEAEIDELWKKLSTGGTTRMGLDKYPWAQKYGWTADRYGLDWQLMYSPETKSNIQKVTPSFLFVDKLFGKGEEALNFYLSVFKNSKTDMISKDEKTKAIQHCRFTLEGQQFVLMEGEGKHGHEFTPAFSFVVNCKTQDEIDYYWNKLSADKSAEQCGWLKDKFGVSWQIVPEEVSRWNTDPKKADKVMAVMLTMKKLDLSKMKQAYEGT